MAIVSWNFDVWWGNSPVPVVGSTGSAAVWDEALPHGGSAWSVDGALRTRYCFS